MRFFPISQERFESELQSRGVSVMASFSCWLTVSDFSHLNP